MTGVFHLLKRSRRALTAAVLLMFVQTLGTLLIPTLMADIVNNGIVKSDLSYIYRIGGLMLAAALLTAIVSAAGSWLASCVSSRWGRDIRAGLFHKVQQFSMRDFDKFGTASMITRSTNDAAQLQDAAILFLQLILPAPAIAAGGLLLSFSKDPKMTLLIAAAVALFLAAAFFLCKKAIPLYQQLRFGMDKMNRVLREQITGVRVVRAFNRVNYEEKRANETFSDYGKTAVRVNKIFAVMMPLVLMIINLCTLGILWFGGKRAAAGLMQVGDIMALVEYILLIFWNLVMGVTMLMTLPRARTSAARINEVFAVEPEITDGTGVLPPAAANVPTLEFRHVTFRYGHAEAPVLYDLNFHCRAGQTTAIIGGTGSGKSTIASLILRFHDIQEGSILFHGRDIRETPQASLRDRIGYVPQKAFLFSGTIADNLRYGNRDASIQELEQAAKTAQASFIAETEHGYDSYVAQDGTNYSGGQRQRLCIARALAKNAELYVFDDSFSALDFKTDSMLRAALKRDIKNAAVVVVAQRVSSILDADQILVLDEGRIAAIGTHNELMKTCELYCQIVKSQQKEEPSA